MRCLFRKGASKALLWAMLIGVLAVFDSRGAHAQTDTPPPRDTRGGLANVSSPSPNEIVSGTIQIVGTALSPEEFDHYELAWAPDPAIGDAWQPIQPEVSQQVLDNVLGLWSTNIVPDGRYLIRLRVVRTDDTFLEAQVRIQIANATETPTWTPSPTATRTPPPGPATAGPSPTPLIQMPPTRTPRPTQTPGGPTATPVPIIGADSPFQPARLRGAACNGAIFTMVVFVGIGLYGMVRAAARGQLRIAWWRFRTEFIDSLLERRKRG